MSVVVITPPAPLVGLDLAKSHLHVDHDDDDTLITAYIAAASAQIDGPSGTLGSALGLQTLELRQDSFYAQDWRVRSGWAWDGSWAGDAWGRWPFASRIRLPYPPFVAVTQIIYEDGSGVDQTLTPTGWLGSDEGVDPAFGTSWPSGRVAANAVRIQYQAGFATVPPAVVAAVLLMVGDLYSNREAQLIGDRAAVATNPTVASLLAEFRMVRC